jgi:uncharacterized membrane protein
MGRTFAWWGAGWGAFTAFPAVWLGLAVAYFLAHLGLNLIPFAGPLLSGLLGPALTAGLLQAARMAHTGHSPALGHLFAGFTAPLRRRRLLALGAVSLAASLLLPALFLQMADRPIGAEAPPPALGAVLLLLVGAVITLALWFSPPLVMLTERTAWQALRDSLRAFLASPGAILVFGATLFVLAVVAAIPFGLGFLVLAPVAAGATDQGLRELFPDSGARAPEAAPVEAAPE